MFYTISPHLISYHPPLRRTPPLTICSALPSLTIRQVCDTHQDNDIAECSARCTDHVYEVASDIGELYTGGTDTASPTTTTADTAVASTASDTYPSESAKSMTMRSQFSAINSLDNHDSNSYYVSVQCLAC